MGKRIVGLVLVALIGIVSATPVHSQNIVRVVDSERSTARLFLSSSKKPNASASVAVARMAGEVKRDAGDSRPSVFDFTVYPADGTAVSQASNDQGAGNLGSAGDYTVISFKSKHVVPGDPDSFLVTGDLTVTYVEQIATYADLSEAYAGPVYGPALMHSVKQEVILEFQKVSHSELQGASEGTTEWSASGTISGEEFPELLNAVSTTNWPVFVADEQCAMPSSVGEDYSGPTCTGKTVERASRTDLQCAMPSTVGEDYAGEVCTGTPLHVVAGRNAENRTSERGQGAGKTDELVADEVKIQLDLRLTSAVPIVVRAESR
jgi:polyisoprenoid-binding protein YceI